MAEKNGYATLANRIGVWVTLAGLGLYVFNMGQWVGAADQKFEAAKTVEEKQDELVLTVNTLVTEQKNTNTAVVANKDAIETSRTEILSAIEKLRD